MIWTDLSSFWAMGGHAAYVWGSLAGVVLAMTIELATLAVRDRDLAERALAAAGDRRSA